MNTARLSESPRAGVLNITRVVLPACGAGRTADRVAASPMYAWATST